ncbi:SLC13 family permease [Neptuniibacter caesariensis]|uniref:Sodium symporter transmembrane region protein n=1 Tax=Neptuniibacter caesariensis TaxID=207954 RepID=A0A7U8C5W1_NEPCE|nr:SLC13 family permease [Neptuniibacter caesariensis]EAR61276.1 sodium symporter transmembrane region protein [Oceanospirillum sp. MED92] [Neptuniibacter caesariensis]
MNISLSKGQISAIILLPLCILSLLLGPAADYLNQQQLTAACLILGAIVLYATSAIPEHVTALIFMAVAMLLAVAPAETVFSGFYSTACWLIFAGLIIGIAINETGLAQRIAAGFSNHLDSSYLKLISGIVIMATLLGFLMPSSMGRAVLFIPIAMAVADRCGFKTGSNGQIGVALAAAFGCHVPTFAVLPANVPNMVMIGAAETIHNWTPLYAEYLFLHFPILGLLKGILIISLILWLYPDSPKRNHEATEQSRMSFNEYKLLFIVLITLGFWLTDSFHHISAAWIGLTAACVLLLPGIGLVSSKSLNNKFNIGSLIFVVGILGLGTLINHSGLGALAGDHLNNWLPLAPGEDLSNFISLAMTAFTTGIVTTLPGVSAVLTPFAEQLADKSGFSLQAVLMTQVLGFSTILFPFQSAPLMVGMQIAKVPIKHAAKLCFVLTPLTLFILFPLDYLWWQLLGWI